MLTPDLGLLTADAFLVTSTMSLPEGWMPTAFALTKPSYLRECRFTRLKGSRENWTPPDCLRLTRRAFWPSVGNQRWSVGVPFCNFAMVVLWSWFFLGWKAKEQAVVLTISQIRSADTFDMSASFVCLIEMRSV